MTRWNFVMIEPTLDDLLEDEIMEPVMRSAGTDARRLRATLEEMARRRGRFAAPARRVPEAELLCCG